MPQGPSLLDYLRNPQAHRQVAGGRPRQTERIPERATLPRRRPPITQQPMGPTGYLSMLDNPAPEAAPRLSFRDASGMDPRPLPDEQFDQWQSRTNPQPLRGDVLQANGPGGGYLRDPATGTTQTEIGVARLPPAPAEFAQQAASQGPSWTEANGQARMAMQRPGKRDLGLFAGIGGGPRSDPAIAALRARYRPVTRPE